MLRGNVLAILILILDRNVIRGVAIGSTFMGFASTCQNVSLRQSGTR